MFYAKDLAIYFEDTKVKILHVIKYFRNHHVQQAWYKMAGGNALVIPIEIRWNSVCNTIDAYLKNWVVLLRVCEEHTNENDIPKKNKENHT